MKHITEIQTERLLLRQWVNDDLEPFAKINADTDVMEYYPDVFTRQQSDVMAAKLINWIEQRGWGFWAVELLEQEQFIGFVGLHEPTYELPVTPCVEIGWRLAKEHWGKGYATEAAKASLEFAFKQLNLDQVYSFATVSNWKSRSVMERLNMINTESNFDHPMIPQHSPLLEHVLYKIENPLR